jgi:hypothetical protein
MATACVVQLTFKGEEFLKPVVARFVTPLSSSDGSAVPLKALDSRLGSPPAWRRASTGKVVHETIDLIRQRVFGLCCGLRGLQRRHSANARPDPQAGAGARSHRRPRAGLAAHDLALRERREPARVAGHGHELADTVIVLHRWHLQGRARRITIPGPHAPVRRGHPSG